MSQEMQILSHIKKKPITPLDALTQYGCFRLAARIHDLTNKGHRIESAWVDTGESRYKKYWLKRGSK